MELHSLTAVRLSTEKTQFSDLTNNESGKMVGMYRIENTSSEHASVLKYTVMAWGERQPDIYLVSKEGVKVYTQRLVD